MKGGIEVGGMEVEGWGKGEAYGRSDGGWGGRRTWREGGGCRSGRGVQEWREDKGKKEEKRGKEHGYGGREKQGEGRVR